MVSNSREALTDGQAMVLRVDLVSPSACLFSTGTVHTRDLEREMIQNSYALVAFSRVGDTTRLGCEMATMASS